MQSNVANRRIADVADHGLGRLNWREAQRRPFLRGGANCVRLVRTRLPYVLKAVRHTEVPIDEMRAAEAARLIAMNLRVLEDRGSVG